MGQTRKVIRRLTDSALLHFGSRFPSSAPHTGQARFRASGAPTNHVCLPVEASVMNLKVTFFAECLCLVSLVFIRPYLCKHRPFGLHTVLVMDLLCWVFTTAFADSFTAGKCCQSCCCASSLHPVHWVNRFEVYCPGFLIGYRSYFCGFWGKYIKGHFPFSILGRER